MSSHELDKEAPPVNSGVPVRFGLGRVQQMGAVSWAALGMISLALVVSSALSALSGIIAPLLIAAILAALIEPLVRYLQRHRVPSVLAVVAGLIAALVVIAAIVVIVIDGFVRQLPEISRQLSHGWSSLYHWMHSFDIDPSWLERIRGIVENIAPRLGAGAFGVLTNTVYGIISFGIGIFFSLFFLFFILRDGQRFPGWIARTTSLDADLLVRIDSLVRGCLRGYFRGTAITAVITAPIFVVPLLLFHVPLIIPIVILYFFLSFIPFIGAWITGVFAVLIAFGSGGGAVALVVALSLLVSNGTIQSVVSSWALGSALRLHPVAVLLATLIGGTIAGILGMILGAPVLSAAQKIRDAVRARKKDQRDDLPGTVRPAPSS